MGCGGSKSEGTSGSESGKKPQNKPTRDIEELSKRLQEEVGEDPQIKIDSFANWGETVKYDKLMQCTPKTLEEIQAVVRACRKLAVRVRAAGTTHTWSRMYADEGNLLMFMTELKRHDGENILLIQNPDDPGAPNRVCVTSGVTTGQLMEYEVSHGVNLPCNVILDRVTYGGVVAPICHGVGRDLKTVCDYIWGMRIVDSDGVLREYNKDKDGAEFMKAIQGNMGVFGIIYDITFDMFPQTIVETRNVFEDVEEVFYDKEHLKHLLDDNWSVELFWFPFNGIDAKEAFEAIVEGEIDCGEWDPMRDKVWMKLINPMKEAGEVEGKHFYNLKGFKDFVEGALYKFTDAILDIGSHPRLAPAFLRSQFKTIMGDRPERIVQQLPLAIHYRENIEMIEINDLEWAIPMDPNFDNLRACVHPIIDMVKSKAQKGEFPLTMAMEMRLMADSDVYLSPAIGGNKEFGGSGHTLYIEVLSLRNTPGWLDFVDEVSALWMKIPGARIHWAKEWPRTKGFDGFMRKSYQQNMPKFLKVLEQTKADPDGIFMNDMLTSILFPSGHKGWQNLCKNIDKK